MTITPSKSEFQAKSQIGVPARAKYAIDWINVVGIGYYHLVALLALSGYFFSWTGVILAFLGNYVFGTIGINVFYHRFLTHKGFQCPKWLERVMAVLAICSFQDTPAKWVAIHRRHHEHSDEEPDPHSPVLLFPKLRGFLWAHVGWLLVKVPELSRIELYSRYVKDVLRDPFYKKLESVKAYLGIILASWAVFFGAGYLWVIATDGSASEALQFGLSLLIWGVFVRTVFVWHTTWSVNSVTHLWGYRNYETGENSRNSLFIGYLTNGEGWHNNHHADPRSARHGHKWWEFDISYLTIRLMGALGLASKITEPNVAKMDASVKTY